MLIKIFKFFSVILIIFDIIFIAAIGLSAQNAIEQYNTREERYNNFVTTKEFYENQANALYKELEWAYITQNEMSDYLIKYQIKYFEPKIRVCYDRRWITSMVEQSQYDTACSEKKLDAESVRPDFEKQFQNLSDIWKEFSKVSNVESYSNEILKTYTTKTGSNFLALKLETYLQINPIYYGDNWNLLKLYSEWIWYIISLNIFFVLCYLFIVILDKLSKKFGVTKVKRVLFYSIMIIVIAVVLLNVLLFISSLYQNRNVCPTWWYRNPPKKSWVNHIEIFILKRIELEEYLIINWLKVDPSTRDLAWIKKNCSIKNATQLEQ